MRGRPTAATCPPSVTRRTLEIFQGKIYCMTSWVKVSLQRLFSNTVGIQKLDQLNFRMVKVCPVGKHERIFLLSSRTLEKRIHTFWIQHIFEKRICCILRNRVLKKCKIRLVIFYHIFKKFKIRHPICTYEHLNMLLYVVIVFMRKYTHICLLGNDQFSNVQVIFIILYVAYPK